MSLWGLLRLAFQGFSRHRLRALLTALGIIIGVGAFVTMVGIGAGAAAKVNQQVASMGSNMLVVFGGSSIAGGARGGSGSSGVALNDTDVEAIRSSCPAVKWAAPIVTTNAQIVWSGSNWLAPVTGTTPDYLDVRAWKMARGAFFTPEDVDAGNKVCVLGQTVVDQVFGDEDPLGEFVRVRSLSCLVVGVLAKKGQNQMGQDQDDIVIMPINTVRRKLFNADKHGVQTVNRILLSATSAVDTKAAQAQVQGLLRQRKRTQEGDPEDPTIRDLAEFAQVAQETTRTTQVLLASIAAVSLIVGGIGIMNIMLVSVTERTREIGIRMAVGAKSNDILAQFLLEALVLTVVGGLVGMGLGTAVARALSASMQWPMLLGADSYALGFGFSSAIGVVFGFYPAWRASRLDPIEALRYE